MTDQEREALNQSEDQIRQEILQDCDHNMLIEASAGAGKTTMLVERLLGQIRAMNPSEIVAITFTEKAADELKGRFQKRLLEAYSRAEETDKEKLRPAVEQMNEIRISTIHAFCNKLLKEMAFEAGLGLDFEVVRDAEETAGIKSFFEAFCRTDDRKRDRERLTKAGINIEQLFGTFMQMCRKQDVTEWVYDRQLAEDFNAWANTISAIEQQKVLKTIDDCIRSEFTEQEIWDGGSRRGDADPVITDFGRQICSYVKRQGRRIDHRGMSLIQKLTVNENTGAVTGVCYGAKSKTKTFDDAMLVKSKNVYERMKASNLVIPVKECKDKWEEYVNAVCMDILVRAYEAYRKERMGSGRITNDELLLKTRDMLLHSKKAREYYRRRYRYFYIDEYQDTDPMQTEILQLLTATEDTIGKELSETKFMDGRFCLIGDPKQSIYAFRGADVTLYARMRAVIQGADNCKLYQMNRNYRSNEEICTWVNQKYRKKDSDDFGFESCRDAEKSGSSQAGFDHMLSAGCVGDIFKYVKGVYRYVVTGDKKEDVIRNDAGHVAAMISNMIGGGVLLSLRNPKTGEENERPVEAGDFMIITRKKEGLSAYAAALKAKGIPVLVNGASSISDTDGNSSEGSPLTGFRKLILLSDLVAERSRKNQAYKLALVLVKVFGIPVSPVEPFVYREMVYEKDKDAAGIPDNINQDIKEALELLQGWISDSRKNPLLAFEKMAQSYRTILKGEYTDQDLHAELSAIEQILEQIRAEKYGTYQELHDRLQVILGGKNEKELPLGEAESRRAVHIMNAHLAKGLEANIVILACPAYDPPPFQDKVIVKETVDKQGDKVRKGYVETGLDPKYATTERYSVKPAGKSAGFDEVKKEKEWLHGEEELRILYVCGTRARECLIISEADRTNGKSKDCKPGVWEKLAKGTSGIGQDGSAVPDYQKMIAEGEAYQAGTLQTTPGIKKKMIGNEMDAFERDREKNRDKMNELAKVEEITVRPSDQEKHSGTDRVDSQYMCGNLYGTMMHKFFELLIRQEWNRKKQSEAGKLPEDKVTVFDEEEIESMVRLAVAAGLDSEYLSEKQCERLQLETEVSGFDRKEQLERLSEHMLPEFERLAEAILQDEEFQNDFRSAVALSPEMPFELRLRGEELVTVAEDLPDRYEPGQEVRVRGTMDLLMETEDKFVVWDYKSDVKKENETIFKLKERLESDYAPQLRLYRAALGTMVAGDAQRCKKTIETKLYHRFRT